MKILFVVNRMGGGGIERLLLDMVRQLRAMGHDPVAVPMAGDGPLYDDLLNTGATVRSITENVKDLGFFKPKMIGRLRKLVREESPDVVHLCDVVSGHIGRIACLGLGIPVVYALHSMASHGKLKYRLAGRLLSFATSEYVAVSSEVWQSSGKAQNLAGKAHLIIHNGVDEALFSEAEPLDIEKAFPGISGPVVASCGRLVGLKNVDLLIRSFAALLPRLPEASLLILGDGPERAKLEALAKDEGVAEKTHFAGFRQDVPAIFKGLAERNTLVAMPSDYEGFSLTFAESLYCGLPVVISEQAAPMDVAGDGVVYCSLAQESLTAALADVLCDPARYAAKASSARELGASLTIENTVRRHLSLYERLLSAD